MSEISTSTQTQSATFSVGNVVTYKSLDQEYYSRGYGIIYESKASTIVSIYYKMANGDIIEQKQLVLVESKSEAQSSG